MSAKIKGVNTGNEEYLQYGNGWNYNVAEI
jgi:hypothetical protein